MECEWNEKFWITVREYVFTFFFENPKNATFYVFLKRHLKNVKNVIQNSKFQTLLTFHYMESSLQLKTMYVYNIYGLSS